MTLRDTEARLASEVEDSILQRLGYNEYKITTPANLLIEPNPLVETLSDAQVRRAFSEQILTQLASPSRPATLWKVQIPRTYPAAQVRIEGVWQLQLNEEPPIRCYALSVRETAARWILYLAPQRR